MNAKTANLENFNQTGADGPTAQSSCVRHVVAVVMTLWLALVLLLGAFGAFVQSAGSPPLHLLFAVTIPLVAFFTAYFRWTAFRNFVLAADLRLVTAIQAWRWAGFGFLAHYAYGILPGLFAFPAGLGDMAVGFAAPWMVLGLIRHPSFAASRRYMIWNILGITDLVVALSLGVVCSGFLLKLPVTTAAMAQLPLILIPGYLVPFFIMLHITALAQARHMARSQKASA